LELRESARARRLSLRVDPALGVIRLVMPMGLPEAEAQRFVQRHAGWVRARLAALPALRPFVDGAAVPVLGLDHRIRHDPEQRGLGCRRDGELRVGGRVEHLPRRVRDLLTAEARTLIGERARVMATLLGARIQAITLRDTRSRWGSCSATGRLSFSWRLIFTPESVFNYVIAHEVAHLREMNHSPKFWALVARLNPDAASSRAWLRRHGAELLRFG
jgi:hypothetical protein